VPVSASATEAGRPVAAGQSGPGQKHDRVAQYP